MKKLALAVFLSASMSSAFAGNLKEPQMEQPVIVEDTKASSSSSVIGDWIAVGLLTVGTIVLAAN